MELPTGSQWLTIVSTPMAAVSAVTASSTGMPAATSAPNTISSRISVIGTEVASALLKFSELSIACPMLASPDSAMRRSGCFACTPATACCEGGRCLVDAADVAWHAERDQRAAPVLGHQRLVAGG